MTQIRILLVLEEWEVTGKVYKLIQKVYNAHKSDKSKSPASAFIFHKEKEKDEVI